MAHESESIFSWFRPAYSAPGTRVNGMGLVAPESQILTTPQIVSFTNAVLSLAKNGLSNRGYGAGDISTAQGALAFESSSSPALRTFSLPDGLDLTIEKGYMKGDTVELPDGVDLVIKKGEGDQCSQRYRDGKPHNVWCNLETTVVDQTGTYGATVELVGSAGSITGKVIRWAWNGNGLIFVPDGDIDKVNAVFRPGDTVKVVRPETEQKVAEAAEDGLGFATPKRRIKGPGTG